MNFARGLFMNLLSSIALASLLGAFSVLGWDPFGLWPISLLGYAGLFWLISNCRTAGRALLLGLAFGIGLHLFGSGWVFGALHNKAAMGLVSSLLSTLIFVAYLALFTALPCLFWRVAFKRNKDGDLAFRNSMPSLFAALRMHCVFGLWSSPSPQYAVTREPQIH